MAQSCALPLLALPFELRTKIYEHLLLPQPNQIYTLYHDRHGRQPSFIIDPTILRVNKQIYSETAPLLYDNSNNIFEISLTTRVIWQCTGGYYPDQIPDPPGLFREEEDHDTLCLGDRGRGIYPHILRRLRYVRILTSRDAVWGDSEGGYYFSHTGELMTRILRELGEKGESASVRKVLEFVVVPDWWTRLGALGSREAAADLDDKTGEIAALLRKVGELRTLALGEKACPEYPDEDFRRIHWNDYGKLTTKRVGLDELMADIRELS